MDVLLLFSLLLKLCMLMQSLLLLKRKRVLFRMRSLISTKDKLIISLDPRHLEIPNYKATTIATTIATTFHCVVPRFGNQIGPIMNLDDLAQSFPLLLLYRDNYLDQRVVIKNLIAAVFTIRNHITFGDCSYYISIL